MINTMDIQRTGLSEELIKEISTIASKWGVQKVILFGSRSRGDYGRASDIDLAVSGGGFYTILFEYRGKCMDFIEIRYH